ncbi:MAG TPA: dihydrolipoamide acetyltransferase family protein, partial [Candidatus Limnocylindria bacterium]|nr:dihydrolipoamide acetyltransferase family protein [Candidatus Limnocylindria bacterium]
ATPAAEGEGGRRPLNKIRRTTAQRMAAAKRDVPHFYASTDIDVEALVGVKDELRARGGEWQRVTVTHLLLKAVGLALRAVPEMNASWADDAVVLHEAVNVGLAVATDDGLLVPVVRGCDTIPLAELVHRAQGLVERVRSRRIAGDDLVGATFTVSNLGMYPVSHFAAVVNPPHAGILAVGAIRAVPVVRGKKVVPGELMTVTLSCDHRVVDGVIAGRFLDALKSRLEEPRTLLD